MGTSISTIREDTITADRKTRLEIEERLKLLEKMVHSQLEEEYLSVVASGWSDNGIHTGMVVDVLKKVNIVMSSRCTEKVEDVIDSFFSEVMLKGFNTLIKFSISEVVDKTSVGEHSVKHVIFLPTKTSILRCDICYYRWNFASKGIIDNMEGVVGVLLLKRVIDVIKTDQKVLDRALSQTMGWTFEGDEPTEEEESESETGSEFEIDEEGEIVREEEHKDRKRDPKTMKRKTARWKRRKRKAGKEIKRILGPEKQRKKDRKSGKYTHNYGGGLGNVDC